MDCSLPDSSVHGNFKAGILEWIAISFSRGSSKPRDQIHVSCFGSASFTSDPSGKPMGFILCTNSMMCVFKSLRCVWLSATLWTVATRLLCPWDFSGKNTGMDCHFLLWGIFLTERLNLHLLRLLQCSRIPYWLSHQGKWKWKSLSHLRLFVTPWAKESMEFSRPEYLSD